jgi:hypothetical protein
LKKVLVVYYTQSGQLLDIASNVMSELNAAEDVAVSFYEIKLEEDFPFPLPKPVFYDAFPESFLQIPRPLKDMDNLVLKQKYDLVVLAYQVWYLSPSIPFNSFLKHDTARALLKDTPVITLIGCRNMWVMSQEKVKKLLADAGARLVGNIALVDRHINHISVITILHWAFTGMKTRLFGIFPKPGVSDKDIDEATKFGKPILESLRKGDFTGLQDKLLEKGAVLIKPFLIVTDKRANLIFSKWSNFIYKRSKNNPQKRRKLLKYFSLYLMFAIWVIAPVVFILYLLTYPFTAKKRKEERYYYSHNQLK